MQAYTKGCHGGLACNPKKINGIINKNISVGNLMREIVEMPGGGSGAGKRRKIFLFAFISVMVVTAVLLALFFKALLIPVNPAEKDRNVVVAIPPNASCSDIAGKLYEAGLTRGPEVFNLYARYKGIAGELKPGEYVFNPGQSLTEIAGTLVSGPRDIIPFTMPEGYNLNQLTEMLSSKGLIDREKFNRALARGNFNYPFLAGLPANARRLEGYLFPDTYYIGSKTTEEEIINFMLQRFNKELVKLNYLEKVREIGLTLNQAVTIASMVEREARVDAERPLIAGVIMNRLGRNMPLQIDATVQYALGGHREKIYYKDLEVNSPYNTYRHPGLPPGPIASPGEASLQAVIKPARTDYLYYVAKPDGTHAFSKTLDEHNVNKAKYIK